jgi:hypothetical protein
MILDPITSKLGLRCPPSEGVPRNEAGGGVLKSL